MGAIINHIPVDVDIKEIMSNVEGHRFRFSSGLCERGTGEWSFRLQLDLKYQIFSPLPLHQITFHARGFYDCFVEILL